jgi:hypothetical protein
MPEALFLKGMCLFLQGDLKEARMILEQALREAKILGSRRLQWQILTILAQLELDKERSMVIKAEAADCGIHHLSHYACRPSGVVPVLRCIGWGVNIRQFLRRAIHSG